MKKKSRICNMIFCCAIMFTLFPAMIQAHGDYQEEKIEISFKKNWEDHENEQGLRPEKMTVTLYRYLTESFIQEQAEAMESKTIRAESHWETTFMVSKKDIYDNNGQAYRWKIVEDTVENYVEVANKDPNIYFHSGTWKRIEPCNELEIRADGNVVVMKKGHQYVVWSQEALSSFERKCIFDAAMEQVNGFGGNVSYLDAKYFSGWNQKVEGMRITNDKIIFDHPSNWSLFAMGTYQRSGKEDHRAYMTNQHVPKKITIKVSKMWDDANNQDGLRPDVAWIQLYANGSQVDGERLELHEGNDWTGAFVNLKEKENGKTIVYTIKEQEITGYESTMVDDGEHGFVITNYHKPETITIQGTKHWNDKNDQDGKRPEYVVVRLLQDTVEIASIKVTAANEWMYVFSDVAKYVNGELASYVVKEDNVVNYTTTYDGFDILNEYTPGIMQISVQKVWDDKNNQDGKRPDKVIIQLYANGQLWEHQQLELNSSNHWAGTFMGLDEKQDGKPITYTVQELEVVGYQTTITGTMQDGYVITNQYQPIVVPDTGDRTSGYLWMALLVLSGLGGVAFYSIQKIAQVIL